MTRQRALPLLALSLLAVLLSAPARPQEIRAFWADGFSEGFKTPEQVDTLLRRLHEANCNAIFAQMRKRGDAYYLSRYDPWASDDPTHWDALQYLIDRAHAMTPRIQVHAWLNTCAVGGMKGNPYHIVSAHPEWLSVSDKGELFDNEATKIDPGHPDAADWTCRVYLDVVRHYKVDGVHFDFVRYGGTNWGYNPVSVARYNARYGATGQPDPADPRWKQWRRDQMTDLVRKVYAMAYGLNRRATISAATITWGDGPQDLQFWNEKTAPMNRVFQDWRAWMREGILDLNCLMSYYSEKKYPQWFRHWIDWAKDNQGHRWAVPSSGIWLNPIGDSFTQIEAIRKPSKRRIRSHGVLLYSYGGTNAGPDGKEQNYNEEFYRALAQPSSHAAKPPFAEPVEFPAVPWKAKPTAGVLKGFVLTADGLNPVDGALVRVAGKASRAQRTDGSGFYAMVDLPPGRYGVTVEADGYSRRQSSTSVSAGDAATANVFLGGSPTGFAPGLQAAAALPYGAPVRLAGVQVVGGTDTFPGNLVVTDAGGVSMRVRLAGTPIVPLQPGDVVAVAGILAAVDGERTIDGASARLVDMRPFIETPLPVKADALSSPGVWAGRIVELRGRVTDVSSDGFVLEADGTRVEVMTAHRKDPGVEAPEGTLAAPERGSWVAARGVATATAQPAGAVLVRLRPRAASDITPATEPVAQRLLRAARWVTPALFAPRRPVVPPPPVGSGGGATARQDGGPCAACSRLIVRLPAWRP